MLAGNQSERDTFFTNLLIFRNYYLYSYLIILYHISRKCKRKTQEVFFMFKKALLVLGLSLAVTASAFAAVTEKKRRGPQVQLELPCL